MPKATQASITLTGAPTFEYLGDGRVGLSIETDHGILHGTISSAELVAAIPAAVACVNQHMAGFLRDVPLFGEAPAPRAPHRHIAAR